MAPRVYGRAALSRLRDCRVLRIHPGLCMRTLDWVVLAGSLVFIVTYGLYTCPGACRDRRLVGPGRRDDSRARGDRIQPRRGISRGDVQVGGADANYRLRGAGAEGDGEHAAADGGVCLRGRMPGR